MKSNLFGPFALFAAALLVATLASCTKADLLVPPFPGNFDQPSTANEFSIYLSDGPADYQQVVLDIQKIEVKEGLDEEDQNYANSLSFDDNTDDNMMISDAFGTWKQVNSLPSKIDILALKNGVDTLLGKITLLNAARKVRITLGNDNYVIDNQGNRQNLTLENTTENLIYVTLGEADIDEGETPQQKKIHVDVDLGNSIQERSGSFVLTPSVKAFSSKGYGELSGRVFPENIKALVSITNDLGETTYAIPEKNGEFRVRGLKEGINYMVSIQAPNFITQTIETIAISKGNKTELNPVYLEQ
jgi:hypothetical protein